MYLIFETTRYNRRCWGHRYPAPSRLDDGRNIVKVKMHFGFLQRGKQTFIAIILILTLHCDLVPSRTYFRIQCGILTILVDTKCELEVQLI